MFNFVKKFNTKIATLLIVVIFLTSFSPIFAKKAEAFFFVDWVNLVVNTISSVGNWSGFVKDFALDAIAFQVINLVIERITASTVNWINSGFKGKPSFIQDPDKYFKDLGSKMAGQYIFENPKFNFLCGNINVKVRLALRQRYIQDRQWQCTLTGIGRNFDNFMEDFDNGGWQNFFELTQVQHNNPIGAYLQAESELLNIINTRQESVNRELNWGKGFMSLKVCDRWEYTTSSEEISRQMREASIRDPQGRGTVDLETGIPTQNDTTSTDIANDTVNYGWDVALENTTDDDINHFAGGPSRRCAGYKTTTPGDVISSKLNSVLNIGDNRLAVGDEINEIITALLNQLVNQIMGGIGKGLAGLSNKESTSTNGSNDSFTDRLQGGSNNDRSDEVNNYFRTTGSGVDDVLNLPPYDANLCRNNPTAAECNAPPGANTFCQNYPNDPSCIPGGAPAGDGSGTSGDQ